MSQKFPPRDIGWLIRISVNIHVTIMQCNGSVGNCCGMFCHGISGQGSTCSCVPLFRVWCHGVLWKLLEVFGWSHQDWGIEVLHVLIWQLMMRRILMMIIYKSSWASVLIYFDCRCQLGVLGPDHPTSYLHYLHLFCGLQSVFIISVFSCQKHRIWLLFLN